MRFAGRLICLLTACGGPDLDAPRSPIGEVPAFEQRTGDAAAGFRALVEEGYVGCGLPLSAYRRVFPDPAPAPALLERTGLSADLPFNLTAFTTPSGVDVVTPNCLQCHAQQIHTGEVMIGLGSHTADYTTDLDNLANIAGALIENPTELVEYERWRERIATVAPYTLTKTIGVNSADNLAAVLFAHRDRDTLAWSSEPLMPLPPMITVPVDVPPWWHMQKKNAMFYVGAGRGDHARIMMTASTLCVDSVDEARAIDAYFPDIRAYLLSLQPPAWKFPLDTAKAEAGRAVFESNCARCHGTYSADGDTYPNLVVSIDEVGTDDIMARGAGQFADIYLDWYNTSFFGELSFLAPAPGYIAPPLDGIWATAPYLHNGSIPTLRALLDSSTRPRFFVRSFDPRDYNVANVGWNYQTLDSGHAGGIHPGIEDREIYDTTQLGYGNGGHTFGDALTVDERDALLEYLKTL